jgi:chromosome segregation ATPase
MADKTKAELEKENVEISDQLIELQKKYDQVNNDLARLNDAGLHDLSWYQREIDRLSKKLATTESNLKGYEEKKRLQEIEADVIRQDKERIQKAELLPYNQSEHTRFRLRDRPSKLNIMGTPDGPVFDLGVDLSYFSGPVQIEAHIIIEMAQSIGMLTVEESEKLRADLAFSKAKNEQAAQLATELTDGISVLTDKFYADLDSVVYDDDPSSETDYLDESSESDSGNGTESSADNGADKADGQADGDNSGEKSDGVSDDSGNADDSDDGYGKLLNNNEFGL